MNIQTNMNELKKTNKHKQETKQQFDSDLCTDPNLLKKEQDLFFGKVKQNKHE